MEQSSQPLGLACNEGLGPDAEDFAWHTLNYRTAATLHAEGMWQELAACVQRKIDAAITAERQAAWDAVNQWIKPGDLGGNGCDMNAQRNGLILASNLLMDRIRGPNVQGNRPDTAKEN